MPIGLLGSILALFGSSVERAPADTPPFVRSSNAFGIELYRGLDDSPGNLVFSPASVAAALTMTWGGARAQTAEEMRRVLHLRGTPAEALSASGRLLAELQGRGRGVTFRVANRLFGERTYRFEAPYLEATKAAYGAPLEAVDFRGASERARVTINEWVEAQTQKRIPNLVPSGVLTPDTRLVLVNAIYFLGNWANPFRKEATRPAPFHLSASSRKDVPTMQQTETLGWMQGDGFQALEMPYEGHSFSMLILLPNAVDGLRAVEEKLSVDSLARTVAALVPKKVALSLPRFEMNPGAAIALSPLLKQMGMRAAFDRVRADFTGIANPEDPADRLFLSEVFHKAFVRTDETGTEAAAATAALATRAAAMPVERPVPFNADHPFLFLLRDKTTGLLLFMGRVADPTAK
jgi:serpin B